MKNKEDLNKSDTSLILKIESLQRESSSRRMELSILITILFATFSVYSKLAIISFPEIYFSYIDAKYSNLEIYLSILYYLFVLIISSLLINTLGILDKLNKQLYRYKPLNFSFISNLVRVTLGIIVGLSIVLYTFFFNDNYRKKYEKNIEMKEKININKQIAKDKLFCGIPNSIIVNEVATREDNKKTFVKTKLIQVNDVIYKCIKKRYENKKIEYTTYKFENGKYLDLGIKRIINDK